MSDRENVILIGGGARIPYLAEYLGWWAMEARACGATMARAKSMDHAAHVRDEQQRRAVAETTTQSVRRGYSYEVTDGVAIVQVAGTLMKHVSSMDESTSTVMLRNTCRSMLRDPNVRAAILVIDSPGGTVAGAYDLADDVAALSKKKPTYAYVQDLGASAAYLQASQTRGISANRNALVGSIGTYAVVYDYSKMFDQEGVKAIVIGSGGFKGAGVPGTEITQEQIDEWQREIDALNDQFIVAVSKGRKMPRDKVAQLADGRVHIAAEAKKLGLIDQVESLDEMFMRVAKEVNAGAGRGDAGATQLITVGQMTNDDYTGRREQAIDAAPAASTQPTQDDDDNAGAAAGEDGNTVTATADDRDSPEAEAPGPGGGGGAEDKETTMSQNNGAPAAGTPAVTEQPPKAATMTELKAALPGAGSDFLVEQAEKGVTLAVAKDNFLQWQAAQIRSRDQDLAKAKEQGTTDAAPKKAKMPGTAAIESNPSKKIDVATASADDGTATGQFKAMVEAKVSKGMARDRAVSLVARENPEIHAAMIEEANEAPAKR